MAKNKTPFKKLAEVFRELEETSSSLKMIDILAGFLKELSAEEARIAAHLLRGEVAPSYRGLELGLAEKLVMRAVSLSTEVSSHKIETVYNKKGDLGLVVEENKTGDRGTGLTINEVFSRLKAIAEAAGAGSQEKKVSELAELIKSSSALEARYIVRLVLNTLRLGVAEMTFLAALSKALTGSKEKKKELEHAFNVLSDLGEVAYVAVREGVKKLEKINPVPGVPIRMMAAQRVEDLKDVAKHIPGKVLVEYKYDGERLQVHILRTGEMVIFSRRHENITHQFPDVIADLKKAFKGREAIIEGEVVAIDEKSGRLLAFQVLMTRRRKHDIEKYVSKVPVKYFLFDILYLDGNSMLETPLKERKLALKKVFAEKGEIEEAQYLLTGDIDETEKFFRDVLKKGAEGVMVKDVSGPYQAGTRGWKWIKYKKDYEAELADTFDLVVVGAIYGTGKRGGTYGSLLVGAYEPKTNKYYSFTKVGAGFTDKDLEELKRRLDKYLIKEKHRLVETGMKADVWFEPKAVLEISGAEITVSPVHTVAKDKIKKGGLALRFPRFLRWREDKGPEEATSVEEIYQLYKK